MKEQKTTQKGITLIALVISIIVMLILAGVSLNATVGDNGIITRAMEASKHQKIASDLESLNMELANLNVDTFLGNEATTIQAIAQKLLDAKVIDTTVKTSSGQIASFVNGGDITGGYSLITQESFSTEGNEDEKGKFTISSDAEVVFMDPISGDLSIQVKSGVHAIVGIYADMTLTNQNIKRSAIDIEENGILDLYIGSDANVNVNSGFGVDANNNEAGSGGFAGIHVPVGAELNVFGEGTLIATGGNGSKGGTPASGDDSQQSAGGGAGAGIGGNGGNGGTGEI